MWTDVWGHHSSGFQTNMEAFSTPAGSRHVKQLVTLNLMGIQGEGPNASMPHSGRSVRAEAWKAAVP